MPVTTRIITALSGSSRKPQSAVNVARRPSAMWKGSPASQVNRITWWTFSGLGGELRDRAAAKTGTNSRTIPGQRMSISFFSGEA